MKNSAATRTGEPCFLHWGTAIISITPAVGAITHLSGRTPHIHVQGRQGSKELLTTQCYIKNEPLNARDGVLRAVADPKARESLLVDFAPIPGSKIGELAARFEIVLGRTPTE